MLSLTVRAVDRVEWSPDSELLLLASNKAGLVLLYSLGELGWRGRLDAGQAGLTGAAWAADSRHLLCLAELGVCLTVWSLASVAVITIPQPKATLGNIARACLASWTPAPDKDYRRYF